MNRIICAWCNSILKDGIMPPTHTICPECLHREKARMIDKSRLAIHENTTRSSPNLHIGLSESAEDIGLKGEFIMTSTTGSIIRFTIVMTLIVGFIGWTAYAQNSSLPAGDPGTGGNHPQPPIFTAIDLNHDSIISADELAKAAASLKTLDKNGDGRLTHDEYIPPRPGEPAMSANMNAACPANPQGPANAADQAGMGPGMDRRPPKPPIDLALDTNKDGVISADEIAKAAASLKKLDKNGDGKLSRDECLPQRSPLAVSN